MVSPDVIRATVNAYFTANTNLDVEAFVNMFAADATLYNVGETPLTGLEAVRHVAEQSITPFQGANITIEQIYIVDNGAAIYYSGNMTAKNGRTANVSGIDVFEINAEGKIQALRFYLDSAPILSMLA